MACATISLTKLYLIRPLDFYGLRKNIYFMSFTSFSFEQSECKRLYNTLDLILKVMSLFNSFVLLYQPFNSLYNKLDSYIYFI